MTHYPPNEDLLQEAFSKGFEQVRRRCVAAEAERDELRERLGECIGCNYNDGRDECCPQHGRTITEWIDIASDRIGAANDLRVERDAAVAENARLLARIAAVEALHFTHGRNILGKPVCAECSPLQPMPCPTLRALAASPTPTGPEPAKYEHCPHGWTRAHCGSCHDDVYGPGYDFTHREPGSYAYKVCNRHAAAMAGPGGTDQ